MPLNMILWVHLVACRKPVYYKEYWRRVRVVERTSLLKRQGVKALAGSNPAVSAKKRNRILEPKWGRAEGATLMNSPRRIQNPKGFSTLRVAQKGVFDL